MAIGLASVLALAVAASVAEPAAALRVEPPNRISLNSPFSGPCTQGI